MYHKRKTQKLYAKRMQTEGCPFCEESTLVNSVKDTKLSYVVPNLTNYDVWELQDVTEHLLIIPRRHVGSLHNLTPEEKLDIMNIAAMYEAEGFNVYARATGSVGRSVMHQHTHLIKGSNKQSQFMLFLRKPYLLIKK